MTITAPNVETADNEACRRLPAEHGDFVGHVLERVGDKWTLLVIANLHDGPHRYSHRQGLVPGIFQRMLTLTLSQLRQDGLVTRTAYPEVAPRVEYEQTELGESLLDTAPSLIRWAASNCAAIRESREPAIAESAAIERGCARRTAKA